MSAFDRAHIALAEQHALRVEDWRLRGAPGEAMPSEDARTLAVLALVEVFLPASATSACPRIDVTGFDDSELGALVRAHVAVEGRAVLAFEG